LHEKRRENEYVVLFRSSHVHLNGAELEELGELREESIKFIGYVASADIRVATEAAPDSKTDT
jgi:hypothetical protein